MKRRQTYTRSKSSVTTSALIGAALVASLGAAAAGFASLDTQPYFKVANTSNPTSQPSTSQPVGNTTSTPPTLPVVIASSTPFSYADLLASGLFNPASTTTTSKTLTSIKSLQSGQLVHLNDGNIQRLAYLSNKDGVMYLLGNGDPKLIPKWKSYAKNTQTKTFDRYQEFNLLLKFYSTHKQGVKFIKFIPGNHIFIHSYKKNPKDAINSMFFAYYAADKKMYELPLSSSGGTVMTGILPLITPNAPAISTTAWFGFIPLNNDGKTYKDTLTQEPCPCFSLPDVLQKIAPLPSSDPATLATFFADNNQAAATAKYPTLQTLVDSYYDLKTYKLW